jgi:hypothetical protein
MRSSLFVLAAVGFVLGGCGWQAKEAPKPQPVATAHPVIGTQTAANDAPDPNQIICRHEDVTGSRLEGHRVCLTRMEWAQRKQESLDHLKMLGGTTPQ